ncbi:hypothetical protein GIB67_042336 [Kingdonia uniflora]|uniref:Uncharacterized protein n=1 Tax=Kingdonia uniflora TaxID=39325 RepID=A0A7J7LE66_9MAGN|nr:hypothetical protein GIB67_042336 [Kingdonia uniflora]
MQKLHQLTNMKKEEEIAKPIVWDCGSSLYDSFELKSFNHQLDSAIGNASRTNSMPRLSNLMPRPLLQQQEKQQYQQQKVKKGSKISRSLQKIIRSMFRSKSSSSKVYRVEEKSDDDGLYLVYDRKGVLKTIPEVPEMAADYLEISQEFDSKVRRTVSERFTSTSIRLYC